jgi:hypothetical protein
MKTVAFIGCVVGLALFSGCALPDNSAVARAPRRLPVDTSQVQVYAQAPARYQEVGVVSVDARRATTREGKLTEETVRQLKKAAGNLGANGLLLSELNVHYVGSIGASFGTANALESGIGTSDAGNKTGPSAAIFDKQLTATAIFVNQEGR